MDYNKIINKYKPTVIRYAKNEFDADDIMQSVFEKVLKSKKEINESCFTKRLFQNETINYYNSKSEREAQGLLTIEGFDPSKTREQGFKKKEYFNDLNLDLNVQDILNDNFVDAVRDKWTSSINFDLAYFSFYLFHIIGYSENEINKLFGLPKVTMFRYINKIKLTIENVLREEFEVIDLSTTRKKEDVKLFITRYGINE